MRIIYTVYNILFPYRFHRFLYDVFIGIINLPCQFLHSQAFELLFDFAEDGFYRVVVRRISYVPNVPNAQLSHGILSPVGGVSGEVVHE